MKRKSGLLILCTVLAVVFIFLTVSCQSGTPQSTTTAPSTTQPSAPKTSTPAAPAATTAAPSKPASPPAATPIKWKAQSGLVATSYGYLYQFTPFANYVNSKSNGRLTIELFAPGAIVDAYEQFGATQKGAIDIGQGMGSYNIKWVSEGDIEQGLPGTFTNLEDVSDFWFKYKDGAFYKLLDEAYREKGAHILKANGPYNNALISRQPITTIDAIKGKKIRASGTYLDLVNNLGAAPVTLAQTEVFMALQTGTIDGLANPDYTIGTLKLWDAGKGMLTPALGISSVTMYVSAKAYDSLPEDLKAIVEEAALQANIAYSAAIKEKISAILEEAKKNGVQINRMPDADIAKIQKAAQPILDKAAGMTPRSAKLVALIKEYISSKK